MKRRLCVLMCKLNVMTIIYINALIIVKLLIYNNFFSKFQLPRCTFPYSDGPSSQGGALLPLLRPIGAVRKNYKSTGIDTCLASWQTCKTARAV